MPLYMASEVANQVAKKDLIILPADRKFYQKKSDEVKSILKGYDSEVEWSSTGMDEGVIDRVFK